MPELVRTEVLGIIGVVHRLDEYFVHSVPKRPPCVGSRLGLGVHHPEAVAPIPVRRVKLPRCIVEARVVGEQENDAALRGMYFRWRSSEGDRSGRMAFHGWTRPT